MRKRKYDIGNSYTNNQGLKFYIINRYTTKKGKIRCICKFENGDIVDCDTDSIKRKTIKSIKKYKEEMIKLINNFTRNKSIVLLDNQDYINNISHLNFKCNNCGSTFSAGWGNIQQGYGCPFCCHSPRKVNEINSVYKTHPDMIKYFINEDHAHTMNFSSSKIMDFKCPNCGHIKQTSLNQISRRGFSCDICEDGISIPEKFCANILKELKIKFKKEFSPKWSDGRRYDFYISKLNMIIEVHGNQHFSDKRAWNNERIDTNIDEIKKELAKTNNIKTYLEVDCRKSNFDFLKYNFNLALGNYFDLCDLNWNKIWEKSQKNIVSLVWDDYNKGEYDLNKLTVKFDLSITTIRRYLRIGREMGKVQHLPIRGTSILQYDIDGNFINKFPSLKFACKELNVTYPSIISAYKNKNKCKGFYWFILKDEKHTEDSIKKIIYNNEYKNAIIQYDLNWNKIREWRSQTEAYKHTGIDNKKIHYACNNKNKNAGGFYWKYKN